MSWELQSVKDSNVESYKTFKILWMQESWKNKLEPDMGQTVTDPFLELPAGRLLGTKELCKTKGMVFPTNQASLYQLRRKWVQGNDIFSIGKTEVYYRTQIQTRNKKCGFSANKKKSDPWIIKMFHSSLHWWSETNSNNKWGKYSKLIVYRKWSLVFLILHFLSYFFLLIKNSVDPKHAFAEW